nr:MAG TPA: hypothetical protein [Caudoviricetes sp.]
MSKTQPHSCSLGERLFARPTMKKGNYYGWNKARWP